MPTLETQLKFKFDFYIDYSLPIMKDKVNKSTTWIHRAVRQETPTLKML